GYNALAYAASLTIALWAPAPWGAGEAARVVRHCELVEREVEKGAQVVLLRCLFNPFRAAGIDPEWLTPIAVVIAKQVYDERVSAAAPILADALEDAGCTDDAILTPLRSSSPHVRGCWALDLILGRT